MYLVIGGEFVQDEWEEGRAEAGVGLDTLKQKLQRGLAWCRGLRAEEYRGQEGVTGGQLGVGKTGQAGQPVLTVSCCERETEEMILTVSIASLIELSSKVTGTGGGQDMVSD